MDRQLKKGLLEACVLSILLKQDSYGYQLIKDICQVIEISESTLYPILKRLENAELLIVYSVEHNGRLRKYYRATNKASEKLKEFLKEWKEVMEVYNFISENIVGESNE